MRVFVFGEHGSGKSTAVLRVLDFIDADAILPLTRRTDTAQYSVGEFDVFDMNGERFDDTVVGGLTELEDHILFVGSEELLDRLVPKTKWDYRSCITRMESAEDLEQFLRDLIQKEEEFLGPMRRATRERKAHED